MVGSAAGAHAGALLTAVGQILYEGNELNPGKYRELRVERETLLSQLNTFKTELKTKQRSIDRQKLEFEKLR